jgi:hypothetical protein
MLPLPCDFELLDVGCIDVGQGRVLRSCLIAAVVEPFDLPGGLCAGKEEKQPQKGTKETKGTKKRIHDT